MCGRYALGLDAEELVAALDGTEGLEDTQWPDRDRYEAGRYNIAPRTHNPIIRRSRSPSSEDNDDGAEGHERATSKSAPANEMTTAAVWGLIPHWMKRADKVGQLKTINARDDTVCAGGMWTSMRHKRCIVIAEGFYEWQKKGAKDKVAHFTKMKGDRLMCFAGFWDSVRYEGEQEAVMSYTIITTASNDQLNFLHDRMPVILATKEARQLWLDADHPWDAKVAALLKPLDRPLDCYAVPPEVGKVGNNSPDFIKPVAQRKGNIASMFAKQASTSPDKGKR
ncbi:uncharacterized protein L969DRAFT_86854, partial [Mixia osmundae IAM 14324]|uniref:uncharacterized protein n=1 Tax=Mixia osmundae (strain CBS 9802 / IAM 14324 / JCM 22182 / KY 12970) TaxID=764103 RepID=UPI0004A5567B